ncbi:MAG: protein kinase [Deltaproteobacteria bacterium]|nr:protein kinase [Deltaproteobacteria bacterium]
MDSNDTKIADYNNSETETPPDSLPALPDPLIGKLIAQRYRIEKLLGEGGMGHVYQATHIKMGKKMAVKLIHKDLAHIDEISQRFEREAISSSKLSSPNCISVTDFGKTEDGQLYLAMELLEGEELDERLEREGKIDPKETIEIISQVLKGLIHAHEQGVIHRDLKPENIFLIKQDKNSPYVKILDFGIAKLTTTEEKGKNLTKTGMVFGTPKYLSPEQALGDKIDHRADIYSVGIILYEMLTGSPAFEAETAMDTLSMHLTAPPPKLSEHGTYPKQFQKIINKAMSKKPDDRYATAQDFLTALESVELTENTEITIILPNIIPDAKWVKKQKLKLLTAIFSKKSKIILIAILVSAILISTGVLVFYLDGKNKGKTPQAKIIKKKPVTEKKLSEEELKAKQISDLLTNAVNNMESGNPADAVKLAREALSIDPESSQSQMIYGHTLFNDGKKTGALYQYQQAINTSNEMAKDEVFIKNLTLGLQWDEIRVKAADMLAKYGSDEDITKLAEVCNSALTNGEIRRTVRKALEKNGHEEKINWYDTLTADFIEQKGCKERNLIISKMAQTKEKNFIPFLEQYKTKTKKRKNGPQKTENACIKGSVNYALKTLGKL